MANEASWIIGAFFQGAIKYMEQIGFVHIASRNHSYVVGNFKHIRRRDIDGKGAVFYNSFRRVMIFIDAYRHHGRLKTAGSHISNCQEIRFIVYRGSYDCGCHRIKMRLRDTDTILPRAGRWAVADLSTCDGSDVLAGWIICLPNKMRQIATASKRGKIDSVKLRMIFPLKIL